MANPLPCPACETGTLTLCTGTVLSAPIWADPLSVDWKLGRKATVESFLSCDACDWAKKTSSVLKGDL